MLPAPPEPQSGLDRPATARLRLRRMASILLIADADWVRNDVSAAIADPDTSLTAVDDPYEGLTLASERRFDLIAIDMQVKSTGGMATVRMFKDAMFRSELARVPVVLLLDRSADVFLAKRAGADAHLLKPFTSQQLRVIMSDLLTEGSI